MEPLGEKGTDLLERFVDENPKFFREDAVMLDWLDVIEIGVQIDKEDFTAIEEAEVLETEVKNETPEDKEFDIADKLDLEKYQSRDLEGVAKVKADASSHKSTFLPTRYNPYLRSS